jgi:hypothetical protein
LRVFFALTAFLFLLRTAILFSLFRKE